MGPWDVDVAMVMAIAVMKQPFSSQAVHICVISDSDRLGGPIPRPAGGAYRWLPHVMVAVGWGGSDLQPLEKCSSDEDGGLD